MRTLTAAVLALCCSAALAAQTPLPDNGKKPQARLADTLVLLAPIGGPVYSEAVVSVRPEFISGPTPVYPDSLRHAGVQGRVLVQAILDTMGRAEPGSVKIMESPNEGFNEPARNFVLASLFRPARIHGHAVRVLVNLPIDFKVKR